MKKLTVIELTKKLISIPSYVDDTCNENAVAEFIYNYCKQFSWMDVIKQPTADGRFNVIVTDSKSPSLLFNGHIDTVQTRSGWKTEQLTPTVVGNKLYGLGASDMKSNVAAMISALQEMKKTKGVMALFYVDEEYDFVGMKTFIEEYKNKITPTYIISGDGTDMELGNGCRGLIEITGIVKGLSAHASRPELGNNAIAGTLTILNKLKKILYKEFRSPLLGRTSCNIAFLQGGLDQRNGRNSEMKIGREGNNVADIAEFVVDIRSADPKLSAKKVIEIISCLCLEEGILLESASTRHDYGAWVTVLSELKAIRKVLNKPSFAQIGNRGFIDAQLLWKVFSCPTLTIGAGDGMTMHKANEFVYINDIEKIKDLYKKILLEMGGGEEK